MNHNQGKVKWVVVIGAPRLEHQYWMGRTPNRNDLRDIVATAPGGQGPQVFLSKAEAEAWINNRTTLQHKYHLRAQKAKPHREDNP